MRMHEMIAIEDFHDIKKGERVIIWTTLHDDSFYYFNDKTSNPFKSSEHFPIDTLYDSFREKTEEEETVGFCGSCDTRIKEADTYLVSPEEEDFYCKDCYEGYSVTTYHAGGEFVGTDDDGWYEKM